MTPNGRWEARLHIGYESGRRIRKSLYGSSRREVLERLTSALRDQHAGLPAVRDERQIVGQYLGRWLRDVAANSVRPRTLSTYESIVRVHLTPEIGRIPLARLGPADVQRALNARLKAGASPRTVHHVRAVLARALNQALRWDLVPRNVAGLVDPPRVRQFETNPLSPAEARRFLEHARNDALHPLFVVALTTGLRQGEALGLQWPDIDLETGHLTVRRALQRVNGTLAVVEPKTRRSARTIVLPAVAASAFRDRRRQQLEDRLAAGSQWAESVFVFTNALGNPLDGTSVTHRMQRLLAEAGMRRQRFHDLRHACASYLLQQGVHPRVVMDLLGHSQKIALTMNTYSHLMPGVRDEAASRMDELWGQVSAG